MDSKIKSGIEKSVKKIKLLCTNVKIFDTICSATEERQAEALLLSKKNDAMIIVGGRTSSNTAKLKAVCEPNCPTYLIETAKELLDIAFCDVQSIGVTAGASTPDSIIKEVLKTMSEIFENANTINKEETAGFEQMLEESLNSMSSDQNGIGTVVGFTATEIFTRQHPRNSKNQQHQGTGRNLYGGGCLCQPHQRRSAGSDQHRGQCLRNTGSNL